MSQDSSEQAVEWPTVGVLAVFFAGWIAVVLGGSALYWWVEFAVLVYLGGWWMSIGHELLHGHPTKWTWVNSAIGFLPLSLWVPFTRYKSFHIAHHRSDLTDPEDDPESFYVDPALWQRAGKARRVYLIFLRTTVGRLTIGVPRGILRYWWREVRLVPTGGVIKQWVPHLVASGLLAWWLFGVVGVNVWLYVLAFCLGGAACTQLRSFVEHAAMSTGTRSAVVKAGPAMSLLFLNNNLHHTHHSAPDLAWYRLPAQHSEMGSDEIAAEGAGLYEGGYLEVMRTYLLKPFCQPDHPLSPGARPYGARGIV